MTPAVVAPAGVGVGELASWVTAPPLTANAATLWVPAIFRYSVWPSVLRAMSVPVTPGVALTGVLLSRVRVPMGAIAYVEISADPVSSAYRYSPSGLITCQHGAVWKSANGEAPIGDNVPLAESLYAETVPRPVPLWALSTNSWLGLVGLNWLPNGPTPCAVYGDPGAAVSRPSLSIVKLSIRDVLTRAPTSLVPSPLIRTSPGQTRPAVSRSNPRSGAVDRLR